MLGIPKRPTVKKSKNSINEDNILKRYIGGRLFSTKNDTNSPQDSFLIPHDLDNHYWECLINSNISQTLSSQVGPKWSIHIEDNVINYSKYTTTFSIMN